MDYNNYPQQNPQDPYQQQYQQQPQYQQPQYPQQPMYQQYGQQFVQQAQNPNNIMSICALVCGVLGLILVWVVTWLGLILAILGIVFGGIGMSKAKKTNTGKGLAVAGLVCGIISLAVCIIAVIVVACLISEAADVINDAYYYSNW